MSTAEDSIRGQLEAAVKAQHAEPPEVETPDVEAIDTSAESVETTTTTQERVRDEKGRFAAAGAGGLQQGGKDGAAGSGEADSAARAGRTEQQVADVPAASAPEKPPETQQALAPPNGWSAEAKAKWHELPSEIMAAVQKREADVAKFTSTRDEHASFGKEIYQTVQPYLATIKAEGGTPKGAIESLLNTAYVLRTGSVEQKRTLLLNTARQFGVDLGPAVGGRDYKPNGQQPNTHAIPLADLHAEVDRALAEREQAQQQQVHDRVQTEVQTEIAVFAADPKNVHFQAVKGHMSALIAAAAQRKEDLSLQDAYDQAVWALPDTRATLLAQQRAEEEQKRRTEAKQKAEAAKRRNVSITGGPGNTANGAAPGSLSIRETLLAAQAEQSGSV